MSLCKFKKIFQLICFILVEPVPEPIVENYELEAEEAKQYDQMMQEKHRNRNSPTFTIQTGRQSHDSAISQPSYLMGTPPTSIAGSESTAHPPFSTQTPSMAVNDRRRVHTLAEKRSFLVRMVSDPKCYNPKVKKRIFFCHF
jgi:hypothetical protein